MKTLGRFLMIVLLIILALVAFSITCLATRSSGEIEPFLNENGEEMENSVAEKIKVNINGYD